MLVPGYSFYKLFILLRYKKQDYQLIGAILEIRHWDFSGRQERQTTLNCFHPLGRGWRETEVTACRKTVIHDLWHNKDDLTSHSNSKILFSFRRFQLCICKENLLHRVTQRINLNVKVLKVKAVHATQLKQAESCWVFFFWVSPLSDPLLLPLRSRSRLIHPVRLLVACWNMPWLVVLPEWSSERETSTEAQREREKEETCGQQFAGMKWPAQWESPAAPIDRLLLMSTPVCTRWRQEWIEELHSCIAAWWVSKRCATKSLWHVILQVSTSASVGVNFYCTEEHSTTLLLSKTSETLISVGKSKDAKMRPPDLLNKACNLTEV